MIVKGQQLSSCVDNYSQTNLSNSELQHQQNPLNEYS